MSGNLYALILAGGSGTRLWPYSRGKRPKQFLSINGRNSMLQATAERIRSIIPPERIYVVTGVMYADLVAEHLPEVPDANIIVEPSGKGTAPCIGLAALYIRRRDPDAVIAVLSSDHAIEHADRLCNVLTAGASVAAQGELVTIGITPTSPATGYGYIEQGEPLSHEARAAGAQGTETAREVYRVRAFVEKPDAARAAEYVQSGRYLWNAGMFVWRADRILEELAAHCPGVFSPLATIDAALGTPGEQVALMRAWPQIENIAVDVAVMERTARAAVIPAALGWSDVGDWAALHDILPQDAAGNASVGKFVGVDTRGSLAYGNENGKGRVIATIGVEDLIIIDTPDVLLVCPRDRAQDVKAMVARLRSEDASLI